MLHQFLYDAMIQEALIRCGRCDISATRRFVTIWTRVAELRGWDTLGLTRLLTNLSRTRLDDGGVT